MISEIPFDAIITLFVFLVGIPALVLQALPVETRVLVSKRWGRLVATVAWPILVALLIVVIGILLTRELGFRTSIWGGVLILLFAIVGFTAFRMPRLYGGRDALVANLTTEALRGLDSEGCLNEDALGDLIELGKHSPAGREKDWILDALLDVTHRVTVFESYEGDALEDILLGIIDVIGSGPGEHSAQNLTTAASIVRCVVMRYQVSNKKPRSQADLISAIRASSTLGRMALRLDNQSISLGIIEACSGTHANGGESMTSQTLFEIGKEAIRHDQMLIAMAALSRLISLVQTKDTACGELEADTLGLLAHFWGHGRSGKEFAAKMLSRIAGNLAEDERSAIEAAARHSVRTTEFRTSDLLREMGDALRVKSPNTVSK